MPCFYTTAKIFGHWTDESLLFTLDDGIKWLQDANLASYDQFSKLNPLKLCWNFNVRVVDGIDIYRQRLIVRFCFCDFGHSKLPLMTVNVRRRWKLLVSGPVFLPLSSKWNLRFWSCGTLFIMKGLDFLVFYSNMHMQVRGCRMMNKNSSSRCDVSQRECKISIIVSNNYFKNKSWFLECLKIQLKKQKRIECLNNVYNTRMSHCNFYCNLL